MFFCLFPLSQPELWTTQLLQPSRYIALFLVLNINTAGKYRVSRYSVEFLVSADRVAFDFPETENRSFGGTRIHTTGSAADRPTLHPGNVAELLKASVKTDCTAKI